MASSVFLVMHSVPSQKVADSGAGGLADEAGEAADAAGSALVEVGGVAGVLGQVEGVLHVGDEVGEGAGLVVAGGGGGRR